MEPTTGIEPVNLFLTKEALYRLSYVGAPVYSYEILPENLLMQSIFNLERETRLELATSSLEG
jgi:hypothetical protein